MASPRIRLIDSGVKRLEKADRLDGLGEVLDAATSQLDSGRFTDVLRGDWLGHALHPLLTDFPLGSWTAAGLLDLFGGQGSRDASRRLVGAGLVAAVPTLVAGLAEWRLLEAPASRRVAAVHAVGNVFAVYSYWTSWRRRREGRHGAGVAWGMVGALTAICTGYLGGHLSFVRREGTGARGRPARGPVAALRSFGSRLAEKAA